MFNCPKKENFHAKRKGRSSGPRYELNLNRNTVIKEHINSCAC